MKRMILITVILLTMLVFFFSTISLISCQKATSKHLDVYVWESYLPERVVTLFEQETGMKLNVNLIANSEAMLSLLKGGGKADIIMPTDPKISLFYVNDLVQPIDLNQITNYERVTRSLREQPWAKWDGTKMGLGQVYAIPYVFGSSGLSINTSKYTKNLDNVGWDVLFDTDLKGRVTSDNGIFTVFLILDMSDIPRDNLVNDTQGTLDEIREEAVSLKNNVLKFWDTYAEVIDLMKNEEVWVGTIADGLGRQLSDFDSKFKYILPKEGGLGWTDTLMIPKNAENPNGANLFIDFMLRPEIAAIVIEQSGFNTAVEGALDMTKEIDKDLYRYTNEEIANFKWSPPLSEDLMSSFYTFWEKLSTVQ
jgi:spermidine/putrescine transport system substrate-binding protein